jgi:hypothetical protein
MTLCTADGQTVPIRTNLVVREAPGGKDAQLLANGAIEFLLQEPIAIPEALPGSLQRKAVESEITSRH